MIVFEGVSVRYDEAHEPVLREVNLTIEPGELALVVGRTGAGKTTLLRAVNGLVPHFTGGQFDGRVTVDGYDTAVTPPRDLAASVGFVGQDPAAGFVTDTVEEELAYGMEQQGVPPAVMRTRVEETLDLLGIAGLRDRPLATLSGGQAQRVAIGSVLTTHPAVLVLDEPTSALDPVAAEEVLATISRLVHDTGITVVVAEHRLERIVHHADRIVEVQPDGTVRDGAPGVLLADTAVAPPVVELGRLAGWSPLPLSVRDARRRAGPLADRLAALQPPSRQRTGRGAELRATSVTVRYDPVTAVDDVSLELHAGQVTALMGRNGSGKSSLLWALQGSGRRTKGAVTVQGTDPGALPPAKARALVGLVPQTAGDLLYLPTVAEECAQADDESDAPAGSCRTLLDRLVPGIAGHTHPRDLSEGQRLGLVLAIQLTASPAVVALDEPTRGLDYPAKTQLAATVDHLAATGRAVIIATHDVEFVAAVADRVLMMAQGEFVADGPAPQVVTASPAFAPQVAKILRPQPWLTPADVAQALRTAGERR